MLELEALSQKCKGCKKADASFKLSGDGLEGYYCAACAHVLMKNAKGYKEQRLKEDLVGQPAPAVPKVDLLKKAADAEAAKAAEAEKLKAAIKADEERAKAKAEADAKAKAEAEKEKIKATLAVTSKPVGGK